MSMGEDRRLNDPGGGPRRFVVTADQRSSRHRQDAVPGALRLLSDLPGAGTAGLGFERSTGDEIQGVLTTGAAVVAVVQALLRTGDWRVGIGLGEVEEPLPDSVRAARGPAFIAARRAVERSGRAPRPVALEANTTVDDALPPGHLAAAEQAETALWLWAALLDRRTTEGWEVVELMEASATQREVAERLGVSASAVSQRLRAAAFVESTRGAALCARLLEDAWDATAGALPATASPAEQEER